MRRKQYCINFKFAISLNAGFKMKYVIEKKVIISLTQPILKIEKEMKKIKFMLFIKSWRDITFNNLIIPPANVYINLLITKVVLYPMFLFCRRCL